MTFTIINTYTEYNLLATISSRQRDDGNYYTYGLDEYSNIINGPTILQQVIMIF